MKKTEHAEGAGDEDQAQAPSGSIDATKLALIAAQPRFADMPEAFAARAALELVKRCQATIDADNRERRDEKVHSRQRKHIPQPDQWPASRSDFFKLIVRARDDAEAEARVKRFELWRINRNRQKWGKPLLIEGTPEANGAVQDAYINYEEIEWDDKWKSMAEDYLNWWDQENREKKRFAGLVRVHMKDTAEQLTRLEPKLADAVQAARAERKAKAESKTAADFAASPETPPHKSQKKLTEVQSLQKLFAAQKKELAKPIK